MVHPCDIALEVRGRGTRVLPKNQSVLASMAGLAVPTAIRASDLRPGDFVGIPYGHEWPAAPAVLPLPDASPRSGSEKAIRVPRRMTDDLAFLLGAYLSEGHTTRSNWSVILTNSVEEVLVRAQKAWLSTFGLHARLTNQRDRCPGLVVSSRRLVLFLESLGCGSRARNKAVPEVILRGTRRHALLFLQGAALDAYTTHAYAGKWAICLESQVAIDGLQGLLTQFGIVNAQIPKFSKQTAKTYYELYAPGAWGQDLSALVPFLEPDKAARAAAYRRVDYRTRDSDVIPGVSGPALYRLLPAGTPGRSGRGSGRQRFRHLTDPRTARVTRGSVIAVRDAGVTLPNWLSTVLEQRIRFAPVVSVTPIDH